MHQLYNKQIIPSTVTKTITQYNKYPLADDDMAKLLEIAADYVKTKEYVYRRYSGIGSLGKLYPGYTIQNEMTQCGLRASLKLPTVYYYLAIFEALADIKTQWEVTKKKVRERTGGICRFESAETAQLPLQTGEKISKSSGNGSG
jgi:hypothetical protein